MEQKINQLLEQSLKSQTNTGNKNTDLSRSELPADKEILSALNSKKLVDCSDIELDKIVIPSVSDAFTFIGKKNDAALSETLKAIYQVLPGELKTLLPSMRVNEIPIAIKKGIYKEFGEYYGLNIAEFVRFCKAHYESETRINTVRSILKPTEEVKQIPNPEQQLYLLTNLTIESFEKNNVGGIWEHSAPTVYNFLNSLGLIIFSTKEKFDIMKDAAGKVISNYNLKLSTISEDFKRRPLKEVILSMQLYLDDQTKPIDEHYFILINKSKYLTLKAFFSEVTESDRNLSNLIYYKKDFFINETRAKQSNN